MSVLWIYARTPRTQKIHEKIQIEGVMMYCPKCDEWMELMETDNRQEWKEETYYCQPCDKATVRKTTYDQNGLVIGDEVYDGN